MRMCMCLSVCTGFGSHMHSKAQLDKLLYDPCFKINCCTLGLIMQTRGIATHLSSRECG